MSAAGSAQLVVAETGKELARLVEQARVAVEFDSEAAEQSYEQADWRLHLQMCSTMGMSAGSDRSDGLVHMIEDWFPNRTRYMEVDAVAFGPDQLKVLQALLQGEFEGWTIHVSIYRHLNSEKAEYLGGLAIHAARTIVQRSVLPVLA